MPNRLRRARSAEPLVCADRPRSLTSAKVEDILKAARSIDKDTFFKSGALPALRPDLDVAITISRLRQENLIDDAGQWVRRKTVPKYAEETIVAFTGMVDRILEAGAAEGTRANLQFEANPRGVSCHTSRHGRANPDCPAVSTGSGSVNGCDTAQWVDIAVIGECKGPNEPAYWRQECVKMIHSMIEIMKQDVRRRFVLGFTLDGWYMRLWFTSRSEVLVSWPFHILETPVALVDFVLRVAYAQPHELGWDETIRRVPCGGHPRYDIDVGGKTYRTTKLLSDSGARALRDRGTRVWEVRELRDGEESGPVLALKDSWVDDSRKREGVILQEIRAAAKAMGAGPAEIIEVTLMDALTWSDVEYQNKKDDTFTRKRRDEILSKIDGRVQVEADPLTNKPIQSEHPAVGAKPAPQLDGAEPVRYGPKVHHRIVFTEVGQRLTELTSLADVFARLGEVVGGLETIHKCGWVHRDISIGNILVVNDTGKITDVEYAKSETELKSNPGVRTGTYAFMSPEVECGEYLFAQCPNSGPVQVSDSVRADRAESMRKRLTRGQALTRNAAGNRMSSSNPGQQPSENLESSPNPHPTPALHPTPDQPTPFRHNPLHDLESIFWVALWVLLCSEYLKNDPSMTQEQWDAYTFQNGRFAAKLFGDTAFRMRVMTLEPNHFERHLGGLLPQVHTVAQSLGKFRGLLASLYREAEKDIYKKDYSIPFTIARDLYYEVFELFEEIEASLRLKDLTINVKKETLPVGMVKETKKANATQKKAAASTSKAPIPTRRSAPAGPSTYATHSSAGPLLAPKGTNGSTRG